MSFDGRLLSGMSVLAAVVESGTFVRVFDIARMKEGPIFGFEDGAGRHFCVPAPAGARIEPGMTVTALLMRPGDWKTVVGWLDHETGQVHTRTSLWVPLVMLGLFGVFQLLSHEGELLRASIGVGLIGVAAAGAYQQYAVTAQLKRLQQRVRAR